MPSRAAWRWTLAYGRSLGAMNAIFYVALGRIPLGIAVGIEFVGPLGYVHRVRPEGGAGARATASPWELIVAALLTVPIGIVAAGARLIDPAILPVGVAVAIFSSALPYTLEMFALRRLSTKTFGTLMSFEPAIAAIAGTVLLKEHLSNTQWSAIALVVVASAGAVTGERPELATERADLGIVRVRRPTSSTAPSTSCRIVTTAASQEMRRDVSAETYWAPWSSSSTPPSGAAGSPSLVGSPSCPGEASPLTCTTT